MVLVKPAEEIEISCSVTLQWLELHCRNAFRCSGVNSCSGSPVQACCCCKQVKGHAFVSGFGSHFISNCALHVPPLFMLQRQWSVTQARVGRGELYSQMSSQKKEASFTAVYKPAKLAQVLELYSHDWHQVTEMHVLCSTVPPLHNQLWMVWHLELTYLKPLNENWVTVKRAAATLQPQSWILLL